MNKEFNIGDKLSPKDIKVGMIVSIIRKFPSELLHEDITVQAKIPERGFMYSGTKEFHNWGCFYVIYKGEVKPSVSNTQQQSPLDGQSIAEAIKTLSQASQGLQTSVSVNSEGELTIYSHYHEKELTFNLGSLDQLAQYVECVKKLDKFKD